MGKTRRKEPSKSERRKQLRGLTTLVIVAMLVLSGLLIWMVVNNNDALFNVAIYTTVRGAAVERGSIPTTVVLIAGLVLSAIIHGYHLLVKKKWRTYYHTIEDCENQAYDHAMARHVNWVRWEVYTLSQTLILWALAQHAGVTDIFVLAGIAALHILLQAAAYSLEMINALADTTNDINFGPFGYGVLCWVVVWGTVLAHHFLSATPVGLLIHVMVIGAAVVSVAFGLVALSRYMRIDDMWKNDYTIEMVYLVLEACFALIVTVPVLVRGFAL